MLTEPLVSTRGLDKMATPSENQTITPPYSEKRGATVTDKNLIDRLLDIKQWISLGVAIVATIVSSGGWVLTYFAKKEEVDILSCTMDVNVRLAKDTSSIQLVRERQIQLRRDLRGARQGGTVTKDYKVAFAGDDDEYATVDELKAAIKATKENLKILSDDSAFFLNSLARKECDSKERRDKLRDKLAVEPPLKGD